MAGTVYPKGLGGHAPGRAWFYLDSQCSQLAVSVGIDDEAGDQGRVSFEVWGDGVRLAQAEATGAGGAVPMTAVVTGVDVLELRLDSADDPGYDHADWLDPQITCTGTPPPAGKSKLGDRPWLSATNSWGPVERNRSVGGQGLGDGLPLTVAGQNYPSGLGGHANGAVSFYLISHCSQFTTSVGIDDEVGALGQVRFEVWGDGARLAQAEATGAGGAVPMTAAVTGVDVLELRLDIAGSPDYDHADWLTPEVTCA
ncbi:MAG: hypothetical protein QOG10_1945 [Kribbellaceae bacterium]|nr:hypothetical protein [Kribbellaceae bacterium]